MKLNTKVTVVLVAFVMMVIPLAIVETAEDSDAVTTTSSINVYYNASGTEWTKKTVSASNLYEAVVGAASELGYTVVSDHATWNKVENGIGNPDSSYGLISSVNGSSVYSIYIYNNTSQSWVSSNDAPLGWYRPFADYGSTVTIGETGVSAGAANIAIKIGNGGTDSITGMKPLKTILQTSSYRYSFFVKDATGSVELPTDFQATVLGSDGSYSEVSINVTQLRAGVTIYGYGSDAYLALVNALGSTNIQGQSQTFKNNEGGYLTYYSWIDNIFGSGTSSSSGSDDKGSFTEYTYWSTYTSSDGYLSYTLGYYPHYADSTAGSAYKVIYESSKYYSNSVN